MRIKEFLQVYNFLEISGHKQKEQKVQGREKTGWLNSSWNLQDIIRGKQIILSHFDHRSII